MPGSTRGRAPVAMMMCLAVIVPFAPGVLGQRRLRLHRRLRRLGNHDLAGLGQLRLAPDHVDLVLLHQEADAAVHALGDAARAPDDRLDVGRTFPSTFRP